MEKENFPTSILLEQSTVKDTDSRDSVATLKRISRKQNETTASRRSISRDSSSRSRQKIEVECFFVKMSSLQEGSNSDQISTRNRFLERCQNRYEKKRSPTPVPGFLSRKRETQRQKAREDLQIQKQLALAELQNKYNFQREKSKMQERRVEQLQRQVRGKIKKIEEISALLVKSQENQNKLNQQLKQYQFIAFQNQSTLAETKSKLQRLKNTIKINRYNELEIENVKLRKDKEKLAKKIEELEVQIHQLDSRCIFLEKQLYFAKNSRISKKDQKVPPMISGKQDESLQKVLLSRDQYTKKLEDKIASLQIQLAFINRKKLEQIKQEQEKKDKELGRVRSRLTYLNRQLLDYRRENEKLRNTSIFLSTPFIATRKSMMESETWATHEQIFCLSLSPEHHNL